MQLQFIYSRQVVLVPVVALIIVSCSKEKPTSDGRNQVKNHAVETPKFKGEIYRTIDGGTAIALTSPDELELTFNGNNFIHKYTKPDNGTLRVIITSSGTTRAVYFRITPQGLQASDGTVLLEPRVFAQKTAEIQHQEQERQRLAALEAAAEAETSIVATFSMRDRPPLPFSDGRARHQKLVITNASARIFSGEDDSSPNLIPFKGSIGLNEIIQDKDGGYSFEVTYSLPYEKVRGTGLLSSAVWRVDFDTLKEATAAKQQLMESYSLWQKRFPAFGQPLQ